MTDAIAPKIRLAGDVQIDDVSIITASGTLQTITPQVVGIEIYEDMFSSFITGKIMVVDSQELANVLPLVGEEYVKFRIVTPHLTEENDYSGEFFIYKMDDRMKLKERELIYVLHFISREAVLDMNRKLSRGYQGKISDIVEKLLTDETSLATKKTVNVEDTKNQTRYVSNFWTPTKNIQFLCDNAVNQTPQLMFSSRTSMG
jgi:hypothetical protein